MSGSTSTGFSDGLLQLAQANTRPVAPAPQPQAAPATAPLAAAAAGLDDIAECAGLLARMTTLAAKPGPTQKICSGHVAQLCKRLEAMLQAAGFDQRDPLWESPVRRGSSAGRFLAP